MRGGRTCTVNECLTPISRHNNSGLCRYHKKASYHGEAALKIKHCDRCDDVLSHTVKGTLCGACRSKISKAKRKSCKVCGKTLAVGNISALCWVHYRPDSTPPIEPPKPYTMHELVVAAARVTYSQPDEITIANRVKWLVRIRDAIAYLAFPHYSYTRIGEKLGGRDHSTIITSRERATVMVENDKLFAQLVKAIEREALVLADKNERIAA